MFPLTGIRVLDLTRLLPGAFATLMLAEMGAEVIKIEDPGAGDPMRHLPPLVNGRGIYDLLLNRGKKSVALDLRLPASAAVLDRLLASSDVVIESFRPRTARKLGVAAAQIRERHPRIIHCAITGYGQTGPYAERPGHDLNYVAVSGLLSSDRPDPTVLPRMFIADVGGGAVNAVIGILAALVGRGRHGEGASLDISMHEAALYWVMISAAREFVGDGRSAEGELPTFGRHACYNVYKTKDGELLALGALEAKFWVAFCTAVGRPDLAARHLTDGEDQTALLAEVRGLFASRTQAEWLALFEGHDVCLTPVNSPSNALTDPHIIARGVVTHAPGLRAVRPPFLREAAPLGPAPVVGQDTDAVIGKRNRETAEDTTDDTISGIMSVVAWTVETLNETVDAELADLPADMRARLVRVSELIESVGLPYVREPHVRHIRGQLWEIRLKGKAGIARALYVTAKEQRVVILRAFIKKTEKTPTSEIDLGLQRAKELRP